MIVHNIFRLTRSLPFLLIILSVVVLSCDSEEDQATNNPQTIKIVLSTLKLDWGTISYGQGYDKLLTITNDPGSADKLKGTIAISGNGFYIVNGGGSYSLAPSGTRLVKVRFLPSSRGNFSGTLSITHNASNRSSPATIVLEGTAK